MSLTVATTAKPCPYCGSYHSTICPRVEEIEYHQDGSVKRVRLRGPDTPATDWPRFAREILDGDTDAIAARLPEFLRPDADTPADSPEPREGIVMVYDWQRCYLGWWQEVLAADSQPRPCPECKSPLACTFRGEVEPGYCLIAKQADSQPEECLGGCPGRCTCIPPRQPEEPT